MLRSEHALFTSAVAVVSGCFNPIYRGTACPTGECPGALVCRQGICVDDTPIDAPIDVPPGVSFDARNCFGSFLTVCLVVAPAQPLTIGTQTVDTTSGALCAAIDTARS